MFSYIKLYDIPEIFLAQLAL